LSTRPFIACTVKRLPPPKLIEAARTAISVNPANAPARGMLPEHPPLTPLHIAAITQKFWGPSGVRLTVQFLDSPDAETRRLILQYANLWGSRGANVRFVETAGGGQIRIARAEDGYWSYLGTDCLHVAPGEATMNLQGFTSRTPLSEYSRVVCHEFGHGGIGCPHEHQRREIVGKIDPQKAVPYFREHDGWGADTTTQQVLTALSDADLTALPADVRSIMCYEISGEITFDGQPIPGGTEIDDEDYTLAAKLYPGTGTPTPTPTPTPQPPPAAKLFTLDFSSRKVPKGGRVVFFSPVAIPAGKYDVTAETPTGHETAEAEYVPDPPEES
jgi:hypothetical protein